MVSREEWDRLVNNKWPADIPPPSAQEAITGAKRLYRRAMGRPFRGKVVATTGNRITWVRRGVLYVNPNERGQGWQEIVHSLAHYCHRRLNPGKRPHDWRALEIEASLTRYAVENGFHQGKLKSKPRGTKPPEPVSVVRQQRLLDRKKAWEAKRRRADTALKKIDKSLRYYERKG